MKESCSQDDDESDEDYEYRMSEYADEMDNEERICAVFGPESDNLVDFCYEFDINDLHAANWGVAADGRYVMIDFCGFFG